MIFDDAEYISSLEIKDILIITIVDPLMFFGSNELPIEHSHREMRRELPPQLSEKQKKV